MFHQMGVVSTKTATRLIYLDAILYLSGGIIGPNHHWYFTGQGTLNMGLASCFTDHSPTRCGLGSGTGSSSRTNPDSSGMPSRRVNLDVDMREAGPRESSAARARPGCPSRCGW